MKIRFINGIVFLIFFALFFSGCAGVPTVMKKPLPTREEVAQRYTRQAAAQQRGDLRTAMINWKLVQELNPGDAEVSDKIKKLEKKIRKKADGHFQKGLEFFKKNKIKNARIEFFKTLQLNPAHTMALDYIKNKLYKDSILTYRVTKGDRLRGIADRFYKNPDYDIVLAHVNGLAVNAVPKPGITILVPMTASPEPEPEITSDEETLADVKRFYQAGQYEKALKAATAILSETPNNQATLSIKNACLLSLAKSSFKRGDPVGALKMLKRAETDAPDIREEIQRIRKHTGDMAETCYQRGVTLYLEENLSEAIEQWEAALLLNPDHKRAKKGIREVTRLLQEMGGKAEADRPPAPGDGLDATGALPNDDKTRKKIETHYRQGIRYYINEDVNSAIREWEIVLRLDPDHQEAKKYIHKARQLQQQLEDME